MARWSDWYALTEGVVYDCAPDEPGVYLIALDDGYGLQYPNGWSDIVYIGSSPLRSVKERLLEHLTGRGNSCVHKLYQRYRLMFSCMIPESPYDTEQNTLDNFVRTYGDYPRCNEP
nr:hypothetical protein [Candidatus Njordarchaeota archaeon]